MNTFIFVVIGIVIGLTVGGVGGSFYAAVFGAVIGFLLARVSDLQSAVTLLQRRLDKQAREPIAENVSAPGPLIREAATTEAPSSPSASAPKRPSTPTQSDPYNSDPFSEQKPVPSKSEATAQISRATAPPEPSLFEKWMTLAKIWLTTGNVPVKAGVIISFFGIAFLLRYAVERQMLVLPIELRLIGVACFGIILLVVGWRLREKLPVYALSLQGGGVGVLYLTIFTALRFFSLLPAGLAFALLLALMCFSAMLAVLQDSRSLAVLGSVGGFLAPILVSTGSGNHVLLFSYYLVLNAAILGIAWFKAWRELNLIGFLFTFVIGGVWGYSNYRPELFASTEPFLIAYFVFYQAVSILFAFRQAPVLKHVVDGTLVFGTPVVAFALQARLVSDTEYGLAISAIVVALAYAVTALALYRFRPNHFRLLVQTYIALAIAFATIAIPLALDARWTATAWALEGAALVWVGARQGRRLAMFSGGALQIGAGVAFTMYGWKDGAGIAVINGNYLGGMLIGVASIFSAHCYDRFREGVSDVFSRSALGLFCWGIAWCLGSGFMEIDDRLFVTYNPTGQVAYLTAFAAALLYIGMRINWPLARAAILAFLPILLVPVFSIASASGHPLQYLGWFVWPFALAVQYGILWTQRDQFARPVALLHTLTLLFLTGMAMWEVVWQIERLGVSQTWLVVGAGLVPGLIVLAVRTIRHRLDWPVNQNLAAYHIGTGVLVAVQLVIIGGANIFSSGNPSPLSYVPLLNPLDIVTAFTCLVAIYWLLHARKSGKINSPDIWQSGLRAIGIFALVTSTAAVVRATHHLGGVAWDFDLLFRSDLVQSTLSIYWGVLGFIGMVLGARWQNRVTWYVGAGLMAVVVVKLFLIDLGNSDTVERIVSFIGTGGLLLVVGYFAPVPPRKNEKMHDDVNDEPNVERT